MNDAAGARTAFAGAVTAGVARLTVLLLTGLFEELPQASLGAVVIVAAAGLVDLEAIRALGRIRGSAIVLGSVTVLGVLLLGVLDGVLIGVILSMLGLAWRLNRPDILLDRTRRDELVARVEGPVYFANVGYVHDRTKLEDDLGKREVVLRFENAGPRLVELARRTPGLGDRCA